MTSVTNRRGKRSANDEHRQHHRACPPERRSAIGDLARLIGPVVALAAFAFSAYLVGIQVVVIGTLCDWCLASDAVTTALAALALLRLRSPEDRSHAWNAANRPASPSSSARTPRARRPNGSTRTRPSS